MSYRHLVEMCHATSCRPTWLLSSAFVLLTQHAMAQQYVLSPQPTTVISGETDPSAQFNTLFGIARFASGKIAVATFDPVGINLYGANGKLLRTLARPGEGPGELRMPEGFGRSGDSVITFDLALRRVTFYVETGAARQTRLRLPRAPGHLPVVAGVFPDGALLAVQVPYTRPRTNDGPVRDRHKVEIAPADSTAGVIEVGEFPGYGLVYFTPPGEVAPHFLMDMLNPGTTWSMVGRQAAMGDPARPELVMFGSDGKVARRVVLPIAPRPFDAAAVREARNREAPVVLRARASRSPARAAEDTAHFNLVFDLSKRVSATPYFRRLVRATDGGVWVELYREHIGLPGQYLRIDSAGRVSGRLSGPANVQFHEFGADYALGVRTDPDTDLQSIVLYAMRLK